MSQTYLNTEIDLSISVVNGAGSATFNFTGTINRISIKTPESGGPYTYYPDIVDRDSYGVYGPDEAITGNRTLRGLKEHCDHTNTFRLSGVSGDGIFSIRMAGKQAGRAL